MNRSEPRSVDLPSNAATDPTSCATGISRRRFLTGATAAGVAAIVSPCGTLFAQDDHGERAAPDWKDIELVKEGDKTIVYCKGKGDRCAVLRLVPPKRITPIHPATLAAATATINAILTDLIGSNRDATRHPGFIVTPHAAFIAWMRTTPGLTNGRGQVFEDGAAAFYRALGISYARYEEKPTRFWYSIGSDKCGCKKGGDTQKVARLIETETLSNVHDQALKVATTRINAILDATARSTRNPTAVLSLFRTPRGLFLAWSADDNSDGPPPRGAVTATSDEAKILAALGL